MASQWQNISIPFSSGVDAKSDPRQLNTSGVVELVNGEFDGINRINKRTGFVAVAEDLEISKIIAAERGVLGIGTLSESASGAVTSIEFGRSPITVEETSMLSCTRQEFGPIETKGDRFWGFEYGAVSATLGLAAVVFVGNRAELYWRRFGKNVFVGSVEISASADYWFVGAFSSNIGFSTDTPTFGIVYGEDQDLYVRRLNFASQTLTTPALIASTVYKRSGAGEGNSLVAYMSAPHDGSRTQRAVCWINESNNPGINLDEYARSVIVNDDSVARAQTVGGGLMASYAATLGDTLDEPISCACAIDTDSNVFTAYAVLDANGLRVQIGAVEPYTEEASDADGTLVNTINFQNGSDALESKYSAGAESNNRHMEVQLAVVPDPTTAGRAYVFVAMNGHGRIVYFTVTRPGDNSGLDLGTVVDLVDNTNDIHNAGVTWKLFGQPFARGSKLFVPLLEVSRRNSDGFAEADDETDSTSVETRRVYMLELPGKKIVAVPIPDLLPADFPESPENPYWIPRPISNSTASLGVDRESGVFHWPTPAFKTLGQSGQGGFLSLVVNELRFDDVHGSQVMAGGSVLLGDASTRLFDGREIEVNSFPTAPLALDRSVVFNPGGTVYTFAAVFRRIDGTGRVHRSEPVFFETYVENAAGSSSVGNIRSLGFDCCVEDGWDVEFYRTTTNGSVLYYIGTASAVGQTPASLANSVSWTSFINQGDDGLEVADDTLIGNATLYTTAEVPAGQPAPSDSAMFALGNRIVLAARGGALWVSKPIVPGLSAEFSPLLVFNAPNVDQIVGGVEMDGSAILFSEDKTYRMTGPGLSAGASGAGYQISELASEDGCLEDSPIVVTTNGAYYVSKQGPCRINRGLQYEHIGLPIQPEWDGAGAVGITVDPEKHLVRYYSGSGIVWAYNWQLGRWSSYDIDVSNVRGAVRSQGRDYVLVYPAGNPTRTGLNGIFAQREVWAEDSSVFTDNLTSYALRWKSGWISGSGPQGYMRVRRLALLAANLSDHTLAVNIRYDYDDTIAQTISFDESSGIAVGDDNYQFRARMNRQKCSAIQIEIVSSGGSGAELSLSNLTLEIAAMSGLSRLRSEQTL